MKFNVRIGVPKGYEPDPSFADTARALGAKEKLTHDAAEAARGADVVVTDTWIRSGEHTSELQSLMRISYAVFCLKKNKPGTQAKVEVTRKKYAPTRTNDGTERMAGKSEV